MFVEVCTWILFLGAMFGLGWFVGEKIGNIENKTFNAFMNYVGVTLLWLVIWNGTNVSSSFWSGVINVMCFLAWVTSMSVIAIKEYKQK